MTFLKFGMLGVTDFSDTLALDLQLRCAEGVGGGAPARSAPGCCGGFFLYFCHCKVQVLWLYAKYFGAPQTRSI